MARPSKVLCWACWGKPVPSWSFSSYSQVDLDGERWMMEGWTGLCCVPGSWWSPGMLTTLLSPSQLLPLPPPGLRDGWSPGPGTGESNGRTKVAGIMGILRPLPGPQPGSRYYPGTPSYEARSWTFPASGELPDEPKASATPRTKLGKRPGFHSTLKGAAALSAAPTQDT